MLEQIAALVKQFGQDTVVNNPDIPNDVNNDVLAEATQTINGGMQNMLAGGGFKDIISMFTGGGSNQSANKSGIGGLLKNPMVMMMVGHFISKLVSKFNMNPEKASSVSNALIPNVITDLVNRTKDDSPANDSFDLNSLIGSLTGGNVATSESGGGGFNFQNLIKQLTGGGNDSNSGNDSGGFDLQDIISKVTSGAQQNQARQSGGGGGLLDMIKGLISK